MHELSFSEIMHTYGIKGNIVKSEEIKDGPSIKYAVVIMNKIVWYNIYIYVIDKRFGAGHCIKFSPAGYLCQSLCNKNFENIVKKLRQEEAPGAHFISVRNWKEKIINCKDKKNLIKNCNKYFQDGDVVKIKSAGYYHFGIYIGQKQFVHIGTSTIEDKTLFACQVPLHEFIKYKQTNEEGVDIQICYWAIPHRTTNKIVHKAKEAVNVDYGKGQYNILEKNCEHFAIFCATGTEYSSQINLFRIINNLPQLIDNLPKATSSYLYYKLTKDQLLCKKDIDIVNYVYKNLLDIFSEFGEFSQNLHASITNMREKSIISDKYGRKLRFLVTVCNKMYETGFYIFKKEKFVNTFFICIEKLKEIKEINQFNVNKFY